MAKFFIDAGHGGTETGAIGNGIIEKNINLVVSQEVKKILELNKQTVVMSRHADVTIDLTTRCYMANEQHVDYFVSIHHNANNKKTTGSEVYCSVKGGVGKKLAEAILSEFANNGRKTRVDQRVSETTPGTDYYAVIKRTNMPSVIVEYGYIDSPDYINFDTIDELKKEAVMIATGLLKFIGITDIILPDVDKKVQNGSGDDLMDINKLTDEQIDMLIEKINTRLSSKKVSDYAMDASKKAVSSGIFSDGNNDGTVDNPQGFVKRQDLAIVMDKAGLFDKK